MIDPQFLTLGGLSLADTAATDSAATSLGNDFDQFLTLLTTQLQNQDPLDPLDSTEFTNQLVQFSQVEQQITSNERLEELVGLQRASTVNGAIGFINKEVRYEGSKFSYDGTSELEMTYFLTEDTAQTQVTILDQSNNVIRSFNGSTSAGEHLLDWDGLDDSGNLVPPGQYELQVGAQDAEGRAVQTSSLVPGLVSGVEVIDGQVVLVIDDLIVGIDTILSVRG
jgi:flagellar basal-body rod modification protein FlgD